MIPILAGLVSMLTSKGLDLVGSAIDGGAEKAKEFIADKTGINLDNKKDLTKEEISKLKELEIESKAELQKFALENKKEDNRHSESVLATSVESTKNAQSLQIEALKQDDTFSKRFVYYLATFWSVVGALYIFLITFIQIPTVNQRFADTTLGFLLGTIVATIIGYFFGSSLKKD